MKKILLGIFAIGMCFVLSACGTSQNDAILTKLGNQLDETANTLSKIQTVNPTEISLTRDSLEKISAKENPLPIYRNIRTVQESLQNEDQTKLLILDKTTHIKSNLSKNIKLSKAQISAIKDLTESLGKYTNSISYSKNDLQSTTKAINSLKKNVEKNSTQLNAKISKLNCNSNARSAYYENLLITLNEIENCICPFGCNDEMALYEQFQNSKEQFNYTQNERETDGPLKNIDTYGTSTKNDSQCEDCENKDCPACNKSTLNNIYYNQPYNAKYFNPYYYPTTTQYSQFNPNRNTDTYGPTMRNIDTFNNGYNYGNYYNQPYNTYGYNNFMFNKRYYPNQPIGYRPTSNDINRLVYENLPATYTNTTIEDTEGIEEQTKNKQNEEDAKDKNTPKTLEYIAERDDENFYNNKQDSDTLQVTSILDIDRSDELLQNENISTLTSTNIKKLSSEKEAFLNETTEEPVEIVAH